MEYDFVVNYYDFTMVFEGVAVGLGLFIFVLFIKYVSFFFIIKVMIRSDYEFFIIKIRNRFLLWTSKVLFYAGRLFFIKLVIVSITNFWCVVFCFL